MINDAAMVTRTMVLPAQGALSLRRPRRGRRRKDDRREHLCGVARLLGRSEEETETLVRHLAALFFSPGQPGLGVPWMSVAQAAVHLGKSKQTIYELVKRGVLPRRLERGVLQVDLSKLPPGRLSFFTGLSKAQEVRA